MLQDNISAQNLFNNKLLEAGYFDRHKYLYEEKCYQIRNENYYKIDGDFPRIKEQEIRNGIGDIKYSIILSQCMDYLISEILYLTNKYLMSEINKYYLSLLQEIRTMQDTAENGASQEQLFTQIALEMLAEAGETENATFAYDEKELGTKGQHKINGYAMSDNYETIDLFISIFRIQKYHKKLQKKK